MSNLLFSLLRTTCTTPINRRYSTLQESGWREGSRFMGPRPVEVSSTMILAPLEGCCKLTTLPTASADMICMWGHQCSWAMPSQWHWRLNPTGARHKDSVTIHISQRTPSASESCAWLCRAPRTFRTPQIQRQRQLTGV